MYLRELFIKNSGPIRELHLEMAFTPDGLPIPHLIVGRNGSGKTNLLSLMADALMEGAATVYSDILTHTGFSRNWFRIVGVKTTSYNEPGSFSILRFEHDEQQYLYNEHAGFTAEEVKAMAPESLRGIVHWGDDDKNGKAFAMPKDVVRAVYQNGAHAFFPSSRSEAPFWLNQQSIFEDMFDSTERYSHNLNKPIYVEHGVDSFAQWLLGVLTESRTRVNPVATQDNPNQFMLNAMDGDIPLWVDASQRLSAANRLLQAIMGDPEAYFYWAGRRQPRKVGVASGNRVLAAGLDGLSGGQSSLLAIFGTILRYADVTGLLPQNVTGLVVIDELDAHMHIELQTTAVPRLVAMFPRVQFVISSHSPFFALGMEKRFSEERLRIIDVSTGLTLSAESYAEFDSAMAALMETRAFEAEIGKSLAASQTPVVWLAGETDVPYFKTAAKLLGYPQLINYFEWIGVPGKSGGGEYTGDDNLKAAIKFLKANQRFTSRTVVAVFDNDANQVDAQFGSVHVIALEKIEGAAVEPGIENLLPADVFTPEVLHDKEIPSGIVGKPKIIPEVRKTLLADKLCGDDADPANFQNFEPYLNRINYIINPATDTAPPQAQPEPPEST
ncbi:AAA family ATPase [Mycobacterium sp. ACS4054]|uniref:AAA family ATPase n=1 Tax=Mycobacterium sp. ACS4054 TaxID=1834119 RepID=UPI000A60006B|nr:AAA family ATPase [Mycobacterium sp. ACS4054]